ncbi:DUF4244 domain-containing protein [uncultured Friedmanniella sp.]|uniref:DUF4244 domain-containing protein n=1 Tax=uncultured Friedmanniella sp. TaxID=335381 RepID=UPI0035C98CB9
MKETIDATGDRLVPVAQEGLAEAAVVVRPGRRLTLGERGMVSAEWAVGIIAAIAIAGVLLSVVTSGGVEAAILKFILQVIRHFSVGLG